MKSEIEKILEEETAGTHLFAVEVDITDRHIDIYMDADGGVNLDDCIRLNKLLHERLEENGIDTGQYIFDVSSPGIDRALTTVREYKKNVGRKLELTKDDHKTLTGLLIYVDDKEIRLKSGSGPKAKSETITYNQIIEAKVTI